jgi:hypothetical protein
VGLTGFATSAPNKKARVWVGYANKARRGTERCHLSLRTIPTEEPYLDLVVGKQGLKIKKMLPGESISDRGVTFPSGGKMTIEQRDGRQVRRFYGASMEDFAYMLRCLQN